MMPIMGAAQGGFTLVTRKEVLPLKNQDFRLFRLSNLG